MCFAVERVVSANQSTSCSAVGAAVLVLPLLQFLSGASPGGGGGGAVLSAAARHRQLATAAGRALRAVETALKGATPGAGGEGHGDGDGGGDGDGDGDTGPQVGR